MRKSVEERFWAKVDKNGDGGSGCWLWTACRARRPNGALSYGMFGYRGKTVRAHRFSWENMADMAAKGRGNPLSGETHPNAILSDREVDDIRALLSEGLTNTEIADRMGISNQTVSNIRLGKERYSNGTRYPTYRPSKLRPQQVLEIRLLLARGELQGQIARRFGVSQTTVSEIHRGKTWANLEG